MRQKPCGHGIDAGILQRNGFAITADEQRADVLIVNTCGFIEPAKEESIDTLLALAQYKETGNLKLLVATGCLAQRYEKELLNELPEVDLLLGVNQYERLPQAIREAFQGKRASYCADDRHILTGERVLTTPPYTAYLRIAEGCDNRCAYCAIPADSRAASAPARWTTFWPRSKPLPRAASASTS